MLVMLITTVALCALVLYATVKTTQAVLRRLDLDLMAVMLWLGLAERATGPQPPRRR